MSGSSRSRFITVQELCELLGISRSRFNALQKRGYFPPALRTSSNRPVFDHNLTQQCLDVVRSRVGINGEPILFNAKKKAEPSKKRPVSAKDKHEDLIAALASLGLSASSEQVGMAIAALPNQGADLDHPALIKAVFLHLKKQG
jgi:predicted DNA-binding transcriptional regulator AlpA